MYRRAERRIHEAEQDAQARAERHINDRAQGPLGESHQTVLKGLCEVRDAFTDLRERSTKGHLSPDEYKQKFTGLQSQQHKLTQQYDSIQTGLMKFEEVEDDPIAYADSIYERYPSLQRPNFGFQLPHAF